MSTEQPLEQAAAEAVAAARQSDQFALVLAAVQAAQIVQQQQLQAPLPVCQHDHAPRPAAPVGRWVAVGAAGSVAAISLALSAIAVAVGAVAVTCCLLVLRSMWRDIQKGR